jgi:SWI/SNF related-matrix-associated actin-dependent regulator of chromatin subfamily C
MFVGAPRYSPKSSKKKRHISGFRRSQTTKEEDRLVIVSLSFFTNRLNGACVANVLVRFLTLASDIQRLMSHHSSLQPLACNLTAIDQHQNMSAERSPKSSGSSKKKVESKKGVAAKPSENGMSLARNNALGMNCQTILSGFYGPRGERIKHTVAKGALQMPQPALDIIEDTSKGLSAPSEYQLPGLDSVVRPMLDPKMEKVVVTELASERISVPQPPQPPVPGQFATQPPQMTYVKVVRTRVQNRTITRAKTNPAERIRGGGNDNAPTDMQIDGQPAAINAPLYPNAATPASAMAPAPSDTQAPHPSATPAQAPPPATATPAQAPPPAAATSNPSAIAGGSAPPSGVKPIPAPSQVPPQTLPAASASSSIPRRETSGVTAVPPPKAKIIPTKALSAKPSPQWTQHKPGPNDETVTPADQLTPKPDWYKKDRITDIERIMLPEWFDSSAPHRTSETYIKTRERIIAISDTIMNRNVTNSMIRRSIEGDAGSLHRLRNFLVNWGFINEDSINDSAPTPAVLRQARKTPMKFSEVLSDDLVNAVVRESKRRKIENENKDASEYLPVDWEEVAKQVGHGVTSVDCERNFLSSQINGTTGATSTETPMVTDNSVHAQKSAAAPMQKTEPSKEALRSDFIKDLLESTSGDVVKNVMDAALQASSSNMKEAQSSALLGLVASRAFEQARSQENALSSVMSQLVNRRMEKLENRMAMIDDVEGILEAERVALELERRDLYTARCRHWYGGA